MTLQNFLTVVGEVEHGQGRNPLISDADPDHFTQNCNVVHWPWWRAVLYEWPSYFLMLLDNVLF